MKPKQYSKNYGITENKKQFVINKTKEYLKSGVI